MEEIYDFFVENIYIFCIIMALFLVVLVIIFYFFKNKNYKASDNEFQEVNDNDIDKEKLESITDEEIENRILDEYNKEKEETIENIEKTEDEKTESNIEEIIKSLEQAKKTEPSEVLKSFEEEQEEQAIISYHQLVESVKNNKINIVDDEEFYKKQQNQNTNNDEKYSILINELENEPVLQNEKVPYSRAKGGFKANEFISPVFGRMDSSNVLYRQGLEYTDKKPKDEIVDDKKIIEEIKNNDIESNNLNSRESLYQYRNSINKDTEILAEDVHKYKTDSDNDLFKISHNEIVDAEDFLNKLKQFRDNL